MLNGAQLWHLAKCSVKGWVDDAAPSMGASLAFYTLFSLTPLLIVMIALAGLFVGRDAAQNALIAQIAQMIGEKAAYGIESLLDAAGARDESGFAILVGAATLLLGATTVFAELRSDLNRIWRFKPAKTGGAMKFLTSRLLSFSMVMGAGVLLLGSVAASAVLAAMGKRWFPDSEILLHAGEFAISFFLVTGLFGMIYKLLPGPRIEWRDVWVGAAVTAVLFWIGKMLIALYIARSDVGSTFGAAGAIGVVIAWVYYSSQVFFLGAEFTRQYALRHGSKQDEPLDRRRRPYLVANDQTLVERAERLIRGEDPILERPRREKVEARS
jgi:membrane protein